LTRSATYDRRHPRNRGRKPPAGRRALPPDPRLPRAQAHGARGDVKDAAGQLHDLGTEKRLRPKEVAADTRVALTPEDVRGLIAAGELYPVFRRNARRIEVFACAIGDWWLRQGLREIPTT